MDITTQKKYIHISPKKLKTLARMMVGLSADEALARLILSTGKGARLLYQAIKSAQADAKNNFKLEAGTLRIKTVEILKGPIIKRWQPVARGMAHSIKKRKSHIKVTLEEVAYKSLK